MTDFLDSYADPGSRWRAINAEMNSHFGGTTGCFPKAAMRQSFYRRDGVVFYDTSYGLIIPIPARYRPRPQGDGAGL